MYSEGSRFYLFHEKYMYLKTHLLLFDTGIYVITTVVKSFYYAVLHTAHQKSSSAQKHHECIVRSVFILFS